MTTVLMKSSGLGLDLEVAQDHFWVVLVLVVTVLVLVMQT